MPTLELISRRAAVDHESRTILLRDMGLPELATDLTAVKCMTRISGDCNHQDPGPRNRDLCARRWLRLDHPWRKRGNCSMVKMSPMDPHARGAAPKSIDLLKNWKECPAPGKKRSKPEPLLGVWKAMPVFHDLEYSKVLHTPHSLDVMHITKVVPTASPKKSIGVRQLKMLQDEIVVILCELEIYFPPAFCDICVHLLLHVVEDIKQLGPTFLHNMMPFERQNGVMKGYVRNRARPDASMAKGFLTYECISFCQISKHRGRRGSCWSTPQTHLGGSLESVTARATAHHVGIDNRRDDFDRAHRVALQHLKLIEPFVQEHKSMVEQNYIDMGRPRKMGDGPGHNVRTYQGYDINGYRFYTEEKDRNSENQNSGVTMLSYADDETNVKERFFGRIEEIWELNYCGETVPMFRNASAKNEPWVLGSQVDQCFFITDPSRPSRVVVRRGKRSIIGMQRDANEEDLDKNGDPKIEEEFDRHFDIPTTSKVRRKTSLPSKGCPFTRRNLKVAV
ncbi:hypothetical protein QYE76_023927 [Lolium multiflorum]|uniref:DUF4218 domain-containing protein n=1 Tax=Lolium multiflorum TaxID=4521 RepID=A0AAD8VV85_LOLMU|nr:hypothetical protein QYE76_023927 [Lolium multiflorum]